METITTSTLQHVARELNYKWGLQPAISLSESDEKILSLAKFAFNCFYEESTDRFSMRTRAFFEEIGLLPTAFGNGEGI